MKTQELSNSQFVAIMAITSAIVSFGIYFVNQSLFIY